MSFCSIAVPLTWAPKHTAFSMRFVVARLISSGHICRSIAEAALKNWQKSFVVDGEAVILEVDGISDLNALHSRKKTES